MLPASITIIILLAVLLGCAIYVAKLTQVVRSNSRAIAEAGDRMDEIERSITALNRRAGL